MLSSDFTQAAGRRPPLIGALLRMPWETVQRRMLERLHERGFDDLDMAHLTVFQYPGPEGARPSELAARLGSASRPSTTCLAGSSDSATSSADQTPPTSGPSASPSPDAGPPRSP